MEQFWREQIVSIQLQIVAYNAAITALGNGVQSYNLNTGQSQQSVTRTNLGELTRTRDGLMNQLVTLNARITGSGVVQVVPAW